MLEAYSAKDSQWSLNVSVQESPFCAAATDAAKRGEEIRNAFSFEWIGTFDDPNKIEASLKLDACHSLTIPVRLSVCHFSNPVSDHQEDEFEKVEEVAIERDEFEADEVDPEDAREFCVIKGSA